jgi:hypothetical protein
MALLPDSMVLPRQLRALLAVVAALCCPVPEDAWILVYKLISSSWLLLDSIESLVGHENVDWLEIFEEVSGLCGECFLVGAPIYVFSFWIVRAPESRAQSDRWATSFSVAGAFVGVLLIDPANWLIFGERIEYSLTDRNLPVAVICFAFHWWLGYLVGAKLDSIAESRRVDDTRTEQ